MKENKKFRLEKIHFSQNIPAEIILESALFLNRNEGEKLQLVNIFFQNVIERSKNIIPLHQFDCLWIIHCLYPQNHNNPKNAIEITLRSDNHIYEKTILKAGLNQNRFAQLLGEDIQKIKGLEYCLIREGQLPYDEITTVILRSMQEICGTKLNIFDIFASIGNKNNIGLNELKMLLEYQSL